MTDIKKYPNLELYTNPVKTAERDILGREQEMDELRATFSRPELCNAILLGEAGSGKALDDNTLIPVNDVRCYVKIKDIKVGDYVFNERGKPVKVIGVFPQGLLLAYKVSQKDGDNLVCNDEHIFGAVNYAGYSRYDKPTDKTVREMLDAGGKWYIPIAEGISRDYSIDDDYDDFYLMGMLFVGFVNKNEYKFSDDAAKYVANIVNIKPLRKGSVYEYPDFNLDVSALFEDSEFISAIVNTNYACRKAFITGVIDAAGSLNQKRNAVIINYHNEAVLPKIREVLSSVGFRGVVKYGALSIKSPVHKLKEFYNVNKTLDDFFFNRGEFAASILNTLPRGDYIEISIEPMNEKRSMTCIYVEGDSHLFLAGREHIVTHNTALIQGLMAKDKNRLYREVSLSKMIADVGDNPDKIADMLKTLFDEVSEYSKDEDHEIVLFIDEFHQIVQLSSAAVEVLKPLLADSGTRGIKVVAATTFEEFRQYISPNQPLVERLQRINLTQPSETTTVNILRNMAERYGVDGYLKNNALFHQIYEYTNRYIPASSQPRKSIVLFDTMIGWHKAFDRDIDFKLLADVIYQTQGVNVAFSVDGRTIKQRLDEKVFSQSVASSAIEKRLQICVADLNDKGKPQSTLLFSGSSGTGKTEMCKQLARILFNDTRNLHRFDMSEYSQEDSLERFRDNLTTRVWERPHSIILLDEIEKACGAVTRLLLQVLDDARLTDRNGRETSFNNAYIVLTTNGGSEIFRNIAKYTDDLSVNEDGSLDILGDYEPLIRRSLVETQGENKFPPELLGRIDGIIPFQPLSIETKELIIKRKLYELKSLVLHKYGIDVRIHKKVIPYIVRENLSEDADSGGARAAISKFESEVTSKVARIINEAKYDILGNIDVEVVGQLASEDKTLLKSRAGIRVKMFNRVVV